MKRIDGLLKFGPSTSSPNHPLDSVQRGIEQLPAGFLFTLILAIGWMRTYWNGVNVSQGQCTRTCTRGREQKGRAPGFGLAPFTIIGTGRYFLLWLAVKNDARGAIVRWKSEIWSARVSAWIFWVH